MLPGGTCTTAPRRPTVANMTAAHHIADLLAEIEVPTDGTLSQTLYRNDHVRVVVFAFDTGQELSRHTAAVPAIVEIVSGHVALTLDDETVDARPGSWTYMPAHLPHALRAEAPTVMLLTMLATD